MHQLLIAPMTCPLCGATCDDTRTNMQVRPFPGSDELYVRIGDRFRMRLEQASGFKMIRPSPPGFTFWLLVAWYCPSCREEQCARVEMVPDGDWATVRSIEPAEDLAEPVDRVDAVSDYLVMAGLWPPRLVR